MIIGWLGSILLAFCGLPQMVKTIKDGHAEGLSNEFLAMWLGGEICTLLAVLTDNNEKYLLFNYYTNILFLCIIIKYKFFPRKANNEKNS